MVVPPISELPIKRLVFAFSPTVESRVGEAAFRFGAISHPGKWK
jgi:hypothetical protein